jgi:hypothetical protein
MAASAGISPASPRGLSQAVKKEASSASAPTTHLIFIVVKPGVPLTQSLLEASRGASALARRDSNVRGQAM